MLAYGLATTQNPVPASHFTQDTLGAWVEQFLIIMLDNDWLGDVLDPIKLDGYFHSPGSPLFEVDLQL